jgi:hypothetical protein
MAWRPRSITLALAARLMVAQVAFPHRLQTRRGHWALVGMLLVRRPPPHTFSTLPLVTPCLRAWLIAAPLTPPALSGRMR